MPWMLSLLPPHPGARPPTLVCCCLRGCRLCACVRSPLPSRGSRAFSLDEDVVWTELAALFGAGDVCPEGVHYWLNCCFGWQHKGSQLVNRQKNATQPLSLLCWNREVTNDECIGVARMFYDEMCRGQPSSNLAVRVAERAATVTTGLVARPQVDAAGPSKG